jgi:hypothetical protein
MNPAGRSACALLRTPSLRVRNSGQIRTFTLRNLTFRQICLPVGTGLFYWLRTFPQEGGLSRPIDRATVR